MTTRGILVSAVSGLMLLGTAMPVLAAREPGNRQNQRDQRPDRPGRGQGGPGEFPMLDRFAQSMEKLNLTDEQRDQMDGILEQAGKDFAEMHASFRKEKTAMKDRGPKMHQWMQSVREKIDGVLTEQQRAQLNEQAGAARQHMAGMMFDRMEAQLNKLDLTADQKTKVAQVMADCKSTAKGIQDQAKDGPPDREQMRQLMQDTHKQLRDILTPEQMKQMRDSMPGPRNGGPDGADRPRGHRGGPDGKGPGEPNDKGPDDKGPRDPQN